MFRRSGKGGGGKVSPQISLNGADPIPLNIVSGGEFDGIPVILHGIGEESGKQSFHYLVPAGFFLRLLFHHAGKKVKEKGIPAAVKGKAVVIVLGVQNIGNVGGQRRAALHQ